jgi:hypothetical protein
MVVVAGKLTAVVEAITSNLRLRQQYGRTNISVVRDSVALFNIAPQSCRLDARKSNQLIHL